MNVRIGLFPALIFQRQLLHVELQRLDLVPLLRKYISFDSSGQSGNSGTEMCSTSASMGT